MHSLQETSALKDSLKITGCVRACITSKEYVAAFHSVDMAMSIVIKWIIEIKGLTVFIQFVYFIKFYMLILI